MIKNSKGSVFYGMHFYPGVAEYREPGQDPYRVYLNEDTLRSMDPSFAGCPIYVEHVDEVEQNLDELRKEADGWVLESFFNSADGKHWVKFLVVSERGLKGIANGMRLSNAYIPSSFGSKGHWNGVEYTKEITGGKFEHLAIVRHPRYEESIILTPDQFKTYNANHRVELERLSNSKEKGESEMSFKLFKKTKVENSTDIEGMHVTLPKSGKEISITQLINDMDAAMVDKNSGLADMAHKVKMHDGSYMNVGDLLEKHKSLNDELEAMKKKKEDSEESEEVSEEMEEVGDRGGDKSLDNEEGEEEAAAKKKEMAEKEEKKKNALEKAERLRKAHLNAADPEETATVECSADQVARGRSRYGS